MRYQLRHAAASAAFFTMFGSAAGTPEPAVDDFALSAAKVNATLSAIKERAVPFGYEGPSQNLDHMKPDPTSGQGNKRKSAANKAADEDTLPRKPIDYSKDYYRELYKMHKVCPALAKADIQNFNAATWFNKATRDQELRSMPRAFLEAAYFTIGRLPDAPEKTQALSRLNLAVPDSPGFVAYLDIKRKEVAEIMATDPRLLKAEKEWNRLSAQDQAATMSYLANLILETLLPGHEIEYPRLFMLMQSSLSSNNDALYIPFYNEIYMNGSSTPEKLSYINAAENVAHEVLHTFQNILVEWFDNDQFDDNIELKRQGKLYYLASLKVGSGVEAEDDYTGYRYSLKERSAWAFQLAAKPEKSNAIEKDFYIHRENGKTEVIAEPPIYNIDAMAGRLPAACTSTAIAAHP